MKTPKIKKEATGKPVVSKTIPAGTCEDPPVLKLPLTPIELFIKKTLKDQGYDVD